jgi:hypothetical protein
VPLLLTGALLTLFGVIAWTRAATAGSAFAELNDYRYAFVVVLILLTLSAVVIKVVSHNPFADTAARTARSAVEVTDAGTGLLRRAREEAATHTARWRELSALVGSVEVEAEQRIADCTANLLEERARRNFRGTTELPLRSTVWPETARSSRTGRDEEASGPGHREGGRDAPRLDHRLLEAAHATLESFDPRKIRERLDGVRDDLHRQQGVEAEPDGEA